MHEIAWESLKITCKKYSTHASLECLLINSSDLFKIGNVKNKNLPSFSKALGSFFQNVKNFSLKI